jgi:hypothetical protein
VGLAARRLLLLPTSAPLLVGNFSDARMTGGDRGGGGSMACSLGLEKDTRKELSASTSYWTSTWSAPGPSSISQFSSVLKDESITH